jgi:lambda family phage portal protein
MGIKVEVEADVPYYDPIIGYEPGKESADLIRGNGYTSGPFAGDAYEGSSGYSKEMSSWHPPLQSVDRDVLPEKQQLDVRVRDAHRNDAYVANSTIILQDGIVGEKFLLNAKPQIKILGLDEVWAAEFQDEVEAKFTLYAESARNFPDAARQNTLTGLCRLAVGIYGHGGEVLASAEWMRNTVRPFSTACQLIDTDRLSNPYGAMDTPLMRGGVERDIWGAPQAYWIREAHPTDWNSPANATWKRVPATRGQVTGNLAWDRSQMLHIIDQTRPDQTRAVARIVSALKETRMAKRFRDTVLQNAVLNAMYAASIESDLPTEVAMAAAGGGDKKGIANYANNYLGEIAKYTKNSRDLQMDGIKIPVFYPGTKMKFQAAGTPGGVGTDFEKSLLRYLAAATGTTYEQLSKDYSSANYSNLRAAIADAGRSMRVQKRKVADRFANWFYRLWLEEAINGNQITSMPKNAPSWYDGLNSDAYCAAEWIGASMGQIDELKETQAAVLRMTFGLSTLEDEHARLGKDWRQVLPQLAREKKIVDGLGLKLGDSTTAQNTMNAASGSPSSTGKNPDGASIEELTHE